MELYPYVCFLNPFFLILVLIETIHIQSFKSLRDVTVELGLLNVFIGANGSGKSNFLEAAGLMSAAASGEVNNSYLKLRGVRPGRPALYKSSFKNQSATEFISLAAYSGTNTGYNVELQNPVEHPRPKWSYRQESLYQDQGTCQLPLGNLESKNRKFVFDRRNIPGFTNGGSDGGRIPQPHLPPEQGIIPLLMPWVATEESALQFVEELKNYLIYTPDTVALRNLKNKEQLLAPLGLDGAGLDAALWAIFHDKSMNPLIVFDFLKLIDWAKCLGYTSHPDFEIARQNPETSIDTDRLNLFFQDRFMEEKHNNLSMRDVSEGALLILFLAAILAHSETPAFCAVDNADYGLNPRLVKNLFKKLSEWIIKLDGRRQLLMTTHNPQVLDGLLLYDERIRLFAVDRDTTGATTIERVNITPELLEMAQNGTSLSQMWVDGYLGGIPKDLI